MEERLLTFTFDPPTVVFFHAASHRRSLLAATRRYIFSGHRLFHRRATSTETETRHVAVSDPDSVPGLVCVFLWT